MKLPVISNVKTMKYEDYINNNIIDEVDISGSKCNAMFDNMFECIVGKKEDSALVKEAKEYGKVEEPNIKKLFAEQNDYSIIDYPTIIGKINIDDTKYSFAASLDGIAIDNKTNKYYLIEVKAGYRSKKTAEEKFETYKHQIAFYNFVWTKLRHLKFNEPWNPSEASLNYGGVILVSQNKNESITTYKLNSLELDYIFENETLPIINSYLKQKLDIIYSCSQGEEVYKINDLEVKEIEDLQNAIENAKKEKKQWEKIIETAQEKLDNILAKYEKDKWLNNIVLKGTNQTYILSPVIINRKDYTKILTGITIEHNGYKLRKE